MAKSLTDLTRAELVTVLQRANRTLKRTKRVNKRLRQELQKLNQLKEYVLGIRDCCRKWHGLDAETLEETPLSQGETQQQQEVERKVTCSDLVKLAEYEELEKQKRLVKLPCAVGTEVYQLERIGFSPTMKAIPIYKIVAVRFDISLLSFWDTLVFATREEAEAYLKSKVEKGKWASME